MWAGLRIGGLLARFSLSMVIIWPAATAGRYFARCGGILSPKLVNYPSVNAWASCFAVAAIAATPQALIQAVPALLNFAAAAQTV